MNKPTKELRHKLRAMWSPQRKEMPEQCASCPFRDDNDKEWRKVTEKLAESGGVDVDEGTAIRARFAIHMEVSRRGDFVCHQSAYDVKDGMREREPHEHLQCPGATKHFKENS